MANTKSALKRIKTSEKRRLRNQSVRSATRTYVKKARAAIGETATEAQPAIVAAISALDRAARKGVIHPNNAARRKSRLMKAFNAAQPSAASEAPGATTVEAAAPKRSRSTKAAAKTTTRKATAKKADTSEAKKPARTRAKKAE